MMMMILRHEIGVGDGDNEVMLETDKDLSANDQRERAVADADADDGGELLTICDVLDKAQTKFSHCLTTVTTCFEIQCTSQKNFSKIM